MMVDCWRPVDAWLKRLNQVGLTEVEPWEADTAVRSQA